MPYLIEEDKMDENIQFGKGRNRKSSEKNDCDDELILATDLQLKWQILIDWFLKWLILYIVILNIQ